MDARIAGLTGKSPPFGLPRNPNFARQHASSPIPSSLQWLKGNSSLRGIVEAVSWPALGTMIVVLVLAGNIATSLAIGGGEVLTEPDFPHFRLSAFSNPDDHVMTSTSLQVTGSNR